MYKDCHRHFFLNASNLTIRNLLRDRVFTPFRQKLEGLFSTLPFQFTLLTSVIPAGRRKSSHISLSFNHLHYIF